MCVTDSAFHPFYSIQSLANKRAGKAKTVNYRSGGARCQLVFLVANKCH